MAIELVQEIGRRTTVITQDTRETVFLFQRLSIALQWGNAVSFLNTMRSRCSRCLTLCSVFTPAALCWWAKKNNQISVALYVRNSESLAAGLINVQ